VQQLRTVTNTQTYQAEDFQATKKRRSLEGPTETARADETNRTSNVADTDEADQHWSKPQTKTQRATRAKTAGRKSTRCNKDKQTELTSQPLGKQMT